MEHISLVAGTLSTFIFVSSNFSMVWKAYRTKDLHSYSRLNIILANTGNLIYWVYVLSLPPGPIWLLHLFYTFTSAFMLALLIWKVRRAGPKGYPQSAAGRTHSPSYIKPSCHA